MKVPGRNLRLLENLLEIRLRLRTNNFRRNYTLDESQRLIFSIASILVGIDC